MYKKIIFLDIDGTLTEAGSNVPPESALFAIRKAQKAGHYVYLCTGRNYEMLSPLLKYGFDGIIGSAGGYIEAAGEIIYDCPMTEEQRVKALDIFYKNGIFRTVECKEGTFTDEAFKTFLRENAREGGNSELLRWREQLEKELNIRPMNEYSDQPVYKIVFMGTSLDQLKEPKEVLENDFSFVIHDPDENGIVNGELLNRKFNKGIGVEYVCRHLGIPVEHTIGFGDSMNDWEMMKTVGVSVCMQNGSEHLKKISDDVCLSVTDDGLYHAFRKYHLI
ncbi:MAG: HAD family hydrolase [Lachnospiraceae bacterium]|nr:HAD family hydrolase [Lachnospiraceae bacterium]